MTTQQSAGADPGRAQPDVLFVITDLRVGGSERQIALLASELAKEGKAIAIYSFLDGPIHAWLKEGGVEVILAPVSGTALLPSKLPAIALHLFWLLLRRRPRVVHFFLPAAYMVGAPLAFISRVPCRIMSRRSLNDYQKRNRLFRVIEKGLHFSMHAVLGNSRRVIDQLRIEGVPTSKLGLIYNGVEGADSQVSTKRDEVRRSLDLSSNALVMCIVANLIPYKGHRDLIGALALVSAKLPAGWRLLIVGRDDGIGANLRKYAAQCGIAESVLFVGLRRDISDVLQACDIGIICSHEEGFSNSILEGMAAGLPMIVTDVGGNAEAVIDSETGFVVTARNKERLAEAIGKLAGDPALRARFGGAGRERVKRQFSVNRFVDSHRKLYDALASGRQPADLAEIHIE